MRDHISEQASTCPCAWHCFLSNSEATGIDDCVYKSKNSDKKPWDGGVGGREKWRRKGKQTSLELISLNVHNFCPEISRLQSPLEE